MIGFILGFLLGAAAAGAGIKAVKSRNDESEYILKLRIRDQSDTIIRQAQEIRNLKELLREEDEDDD